MHSSAQTERNMMCPGTLFSDLKSVPSSKNNDKDACEKLKLPS